MRKVLLVEDDVNLRESLLECLELAGLDVDGTASAIEFYQALNSAVYDVAVVDLGLPDQSGFEVVGFLRRRTPLGIIILTARSSVKDRVKGYDAGADLYMVKPVDCRELASAIRNLAQRISSQADSPTQSRDTWVLERMRWHLVAPSGISVKLTAKEMQLVEILVAAAGQAVTREQLMATLEYPQDLYANRALDAMVGRLRKKIEVAVGRDTPIQTIHAVGYCFSAPSMLI
jgi:DNA-binding response OmpR family regulator